LVAAFEKNMEYMAIDSVFHLKRSILNYNSKN
jgi:hypothetical protein